MALKIDKEFASLIEPLQEAELEQLEKSILEEGCRDAIIAWNDTILDGHNRYRICIKNDIEFRVLYMDFDSRDDAMIWMLDNQIGRRNLTIAMRGSLVLRKEEIEAARAKERQATSTGGNNPQLQEIFPEADKGQTRDKLAKQVNISGRTLAKIKRVETTGVDKLKKLYKKSNSDVSVSLAENIAKMDDNEQEQVVDKINTGVKPTDAYREVLFKNQPKEKLRPIRDNFERLANLCMSFTEGLQLWADGTVVPDTLLEQTNAQTIRDSAPNIIAQYIRLGVDIDWCVGVARGEENGRIAHGSGQETEGERLQGDTVIDVVPD